MSNPKVVELQCRIMQRSIVKRFLEGVAPDLVKKSEQLLKIEIFRKELFSLFLSVVVGKWNEYIFTIWWRRMEAVPPMSKRINRISM